jgi:hypothetical protein
MRKDQARREEAWADNLYVDLKCSAPPMDLHAAARKCQVNRLKLRPMIQRGALLPSLGGYEVILRNLEPKDLDVESPEPANELSSQQRFTLAHEIAHTRFYKTAKGKLVPDDGPKKYAYNGEIGLEEICDRVAGHLLVPTQFLKSEVRGSLDSDFERIDAGFVRAMVGKFRVSYDVVIRRLWATDPENVFARCILLVGRDNEGPLIRASYRGTSLYSALPPPKEWQPVQDWLPELPLEAINHSGAGAWYLDRQGRKFQIQKFPLGKGGSFLLQFDDQGRRAPDSGFSWGD